MSEEVAGQWVRHYDNLQWTVTSILLAVDGAFLVFAADPAKFRTLFGCAGLLVTVLVMLFSATMREARQRFQAQLPDEVRRLISFGRTWYLWRGFETLTFLLAASWTWLLIDRPDARQWFWAIPGVTIALVVTIIGESVNKPSKQYRLDV